MNRAVAFLIERASVIFALGKRIAALIGAEIAKVPKAVSRAGPKKQSPTQGKKLGRAEAMPSGTLVPLAINGEFVLLERTAKSTPEWRSLKLTRYPGETGKKNNWFLGWDGARLARTTDAARLAADHPAIYFRGEPMPDAVFDQRLQEHARHQAVQSLGVDFLDEAQLLAEPYHLDCHVIVNKCQLLAQRREIVGLAQQPAENAGQAVNHAAGLLGIAANER